MPALRKLAPPPMTVAEFLEWDAPDGRRWQLIDGVPLAMAPAADRHGSLQGEIARLLGNHLLATFRPCRVVTAGGIVPNAHANRNFRIPDVVVTCAPPGTGVMVEDPVVLIEILSPGYQSMTWNNVWAFTTIPSVQEILVLHSARQEAELLRRRPDREWPRDPDMIGPGGTVHLDSLDFSAPIGAFYRTTTLAQG